MKRKLFALALALLLVLSLAACGGSKSAEFTAEAPAASADMAYPMEPGMAEEMGFDFSSTASGGTNGGAAYPAGQKLIRTAQMNLETTDFEKAVQGLTDLTEQMGGYFESSSVGKRSNGRWADYTVRIPAEKYQSFLDQAGELCHETWRDTQQEDISERYYDTQGRLKTQQIKLERLQALLAKAENMEDIITIESAISETEQMIDDLSGTLRHYDDQVDYATVSISLSEVYKLSDVEEVPDSFISRLGKAFSGGWSDFTDGLENFAVALAYGWMWVLILAAVAVAVVRIFRKRRRKAKKADDKPEKPC